MTEYLSKILKDVHQEHKGKEFTPAANHLYEVKKWHEISAKTTHRSSTPSCPSSWFLANGIGSTYYLRWNY